MNVRKSHLFLEQPVNSVTCSPKNLWAPFSDKGWETNLQSISVTNNDFFFYWASIFCFKMSNFTCHKWSVIFISFTTKGNREMFWFINTLELQLLPWNNCCDEIYLRVQQRSKMAQKPEVTQGDLREVEFNHKNRRQALLKKTRGPSASASWTPATPGKQQGSKLAIHTHGLMAPPWNGLISF